MLPTRLGRFYIVIVRQSAILQEPLQGNMAFRIVILDIKMNVYLGSRKGDFEMCLFKAGIKNTGEACTGSAARKAEEPHCIYYKTKKYQVVSISRILKHFCLK